MSEIVLETTNITKSFRGVEVLKNVSILLEEGRIYGLVGLNGAGKTTLLNIIVGLKRSDSGKVTLFNESGGKYLASKRKNIGYVADIPAIYPEMNTYDNVNMALISKGLPNKELVDKAIKAVKLDEFKEKKAKKLTLGLQKRLGIAGALVGEPDILILDEPTSGLDPVSIVEIRELLLRINREKNVTLLVSSHVLEEMDQLVTDYIIIHEGRIIEAISRNELHEKCQRYISLKTNSSSLTTTVIEKYLHTSNYKVMPSGSINLYDYVDELNLVLTCLIKHNISIHSLNVHEESLETYFINSIGGEVL